MGKAADQFRKRLLALRERRGDVAAFVQATGFARQTVENWIDGKSVPGLDALERIAAGLNVPTVAVIADPEDQPWSRVPEELLVALSQVHPDHYPIVLNFLMSFTVEREASKVAKGLEESRGSRKKRSK